MDFVQFLHDLTDEILADSESAVKRAHLKHYETDGPDVIHQRLKALYVLTVRGVQERNLGPMMAYADQIATERFKAGYDLWEVQTAFNVLEEAIWKRIFQKMPPRDVAEALGLVSTVLGAGKDSLACAYVALATKTRTPSLNLRAMFSGAS